jgi:hypothetical protein
MDEGRSCLDEASFRLDGGTSSRDRASSHRVRGSSRRDGGTSGRDRLRPARTEARPVRTKHSSRRDQAWRRAGHRNALHVREGAAAAPDVSTAEQRGPVSARHWRAHDGMVGRRRSRRGGHRRARCMRIAAGHRTEHDYRRLVREPARCPLAGHQRLDPAPHWLAIARVAIHYFWWGPDLEDLTLTAIDNALSTTTCTPTIADDAHAIVHNLRGRSDRVRDRVRDARLAAIARRACR